MLEIVVVVPDKVVVDNKVIPPLEGVAQLGTPDATVRTCALVPMPSLAGLLALEAYIISPVVVSKVGWIPPSILGILPTVILDYLTSESVKGHCCT